MKGSKDTTPKNMTVDKDLTDGRLREIITQLLPTDLGSYIPNDGR